MMLLVGQFNYGKRGILDVTHSRLFTFASLKRLFEQAGFTVGRPTGMPAPFPLAVNSRRVGRALVRLNQLLIAVSPGLFAFQSFMEVRAQPSLEYLLARAEEERRVRS